MLKRSDVDRIVFGCGNFGGIGSAPHLRSAGDSEEQALQLLDHARRVGLRRFDTANTYGGGSSEIILGKWLRSQSPSFVRNAQIATKVGNPHGCPPGESPLSRTQIARHLDQSLRRLGIERIDLYYIHEFDGVTPLEETLEAMTRAVDAGKIAGFGISNASLSDVKTVRSLAGNSLASRFEFVQNEYKMLATANSEALIPYCAEHRLRYTAFSPLAGGLLTGKYRRGEDPPARQPPRPSAGGLCRPFDRRSLRSDRTSETNGRGTSPNRRRSRPALHPRHAGRRRLNHRATPHRTFRDFRFRATMTRRAQCPL